MFSLSSLNSVTKIFVITVKGSNQPPSHLLCERPGCYHSTSKTHIDRIFKLSPFMLQWFSDSLNSLNSVKVLLYLGKTPVSDPERWDGVMGHSPHHENSSKTKLPKAVSETFVLDGSVLRTRYDKMLDHCHLLFRKKSYHHESQCVFGFQTLTIFSFMITQKVCCKWIEILHFYSYLVFLHGDVLVW